MVTIRTLDPGLDKWPPCWAHADYVGEKWGLEHPLGRAATRQQERALLRLWAELYHSQRLKIPMVENVQDLKAAFGLLKESMVSEGLIDKDATLEQMLASNALFPVGSMLETPKAIEFCEEILSLVQFGSIGTNDLIAKIYDIDRVRVDLSAVYYATVRPLVVVWIARAVELEKQAGKDMSICGDLAAMRKFWFVWEALRRRELKVTLSVPGPKIPEFLTWEQLMATQQFPLVEKAVEAVGKILGRSAEDFSQEREESRALEESENTRLDEILSAAERELEDYLSDEAEAAAEIGSRP